MQEKRHNEMDKMQLRIRSEENKHEAQVLKGQAERAQMENHSAERFSIHFIEWFRPKKHLGFIVNLKQPLSEDEIKSRMLKAFGDL